MEFRTTERPPRNFPIPKIQYSRGWKTEHVSKLNGRGLFCFPFTKMVAILVLDHWKTELQNVLYSSPH